jgi:hypothetical protein
MARDRNCATASCACLAQLGITLRRHWTRGMPFLYPGVGETPMCSSRDRQRGKGLIEGHGRWIVAEELYPISAVDPDTPT